MPQPIITDLNNRYMAKTTIIAWGETLTFLNFPNKAVRQSSL